MRRPRWSLRNRLMLIGLIASLSAWLAGGAAMYWAAEQEDDALFDTRLEQLAQTVLKFSAHEILEIEAEGRADKEHVETLITLGTRYAYQIWSREGGMLLHSSNASATVAMAPIGEPGFVSKTVDGHAVRIYTSADPTGQMAIEVSERIDARDHMVAIFGWVFFLLLLSSVGFVSLLTWLLLRYAMRSVSSSAAQLKRRSPLDLTEIQDDDPPREMVPMIDSINELFRRIDHAMSVQRGFIAVAAHELRTPLAGLRAHAQVACRAHTREQRTESLGAVMQGVDRAAYMLDQLLDLARVDALLEERALIEARYQTVRFAALFDKIARDLRAGALPQAPSLRAAFDAPGMRGIEFGVEMLMANLLKNAIAYSPPGGVIEVATAVRDGGVVLTVDDAGPGIPPADRQKVFERFYRQPGQQVDGVGLGLSIVQAVVQAHGAAVQLLASRLGGLRVEVHFPAPPPSTDRAPLALSGSRSAHFSGA